MFSRNGTSSAMPHATAGVVRLLEDMFAAAIAVAQPARRVPAFLPPPPSGKTIVIGAGKASAAMAKAIATPV